MNAHVLDYLMKVSTDMRMNPHKYSYEELGMVMVRLQEFK